MLGRELKVRYGDVLAQNDGESAVIWVDLRRNIKFIFIVLVDGKGEC